MKRNLAQGIVMMCCVLAAMTNPSRAQVFDDSLINGFDSGWSWVREVSSEWQNTANGLEVRSHLGSIYLTNPNDTHNILIRPIDVSNDVDISVRVHATTQYWGEQAGIIFYYDDDNYVKLVIENLSNNQAFLITLREENGYVDHPHNPSLPDYPGDDEIRIDFGAPLYSYTWDIDLRLVLVNGQVTTYWKFPAQSTWTMHPETLPLPVKAGQWYAGLLTMWGDNTSPYDWHWQRYSNFHMDTTTDPDGGLLAHYTLDETAGSTAEDSSTYQSDATVYNGSWQTGQIDGSLSLNGTSTYAETTSLSQMPTGSSPVSVCGWAKSGSTSSGYHIIASLGSPAANQGIWIGRIGDDLGAGAYASTSITKNDVFTDSQWHHITLTYDGQTFKLYEDAVLAGQVNNSSMNLNPSVLRVGRQTNANPEFWSGGIDDVRVYDHALSVAEIQTIMQGPPQQNQAPVVNAGSDQMITLPTDSVQLSGSVSDDGLPFASVTSEWTKQSGPGSVIFVDDSSPSTSATFGSAGTYVLQLSADDGDLTSSDTMTVVVNQATGNGLEVDLTLDDGTGSIAADASGNGRSGMLQGDTDWIAGLASGGVIFDGSGDKVVVSHDSGIAFGVDGSYTLAAWVHLSTLPGQWTGIVTKSRDSAPWFGLWLDSANHWIAGAYGSNLVGPVATLGWHHIAVVQDGSAGTRTLYVDGTSVQTGIAKAATGTGDLVIGGATGVSEDFTGIIDQVKLYSIALNSTEIDALAASDLQLHLALTDGSGSTALDSSGNTHNGSLQGDATWMTGLNGAVTLDGNGDSIVIAHDAALTFTASESYTLSVWVNLPTLPNKWTGVVTKSRDVSPWYGIWLDNTNRWIAGAYGNNVVGPVATTGWHHVAVVQDGSAGTRILYVDGSPVQTGTSANASGIGALMIGAAGSVNENLAGTIDDVRLYRAALSSQAIVGLAIMP